MGKKRFTIEDHERATEGGECRKDAAVIDKTPVAYKSIDAVMGGTEELLLLLALAGEGEFVSVRPSRHTLTNIEVIHKLLPVRRSSKQQYEDVF